MILDEIYKKISKLSSESDREIAIYYGHEERLLILKSLNEDHNCSACTIRYGELTHLFGVRTVLVKEDNHLNVAYQL